MTIQISYLCPFKKERVVAGSTTPKKRLMVGGSHYVKYALETNQTGYVFGFATLFDCETNEEVKVREATVCLRRGSDKHGEPLYDHDILSDGSYLYIVDKGMVIEMELFEFLTHSIGEVEVVGNLATHPKALKLLYEDNIRVEELDSLR